MIVLSFAQRLNSMQFAQIEALMGGTVTTQICFPAQFRDSQSYSDQIKAFQARLKLSPEEIRTEKFVVNLPSQNIDALLVMIALNELLGYFPSVMRIHPSQFSIPLRNDVIEVIDPAKVLNELKA